jgi:hypothetical protein
LTYLPALKRVGLWSHIRVPISSFEGVLEYWSYGVLEKAIADPSLQQQVIGIAKFFGHGFREQAFKATINISGGAGWQSLQLVCWMREKKDCG